jgi:hypothetical protein
LGQVVEEGLFDGGDVSLAGLLGDVGIEDTGACGGVGGEGKGHDE